MPLIHSTYEPYIANLHVHTWDVVVALGSGESIECVAAKFSTVCSHIFKIQPITDF